MAEKSTNEKPDKPKSRKGLPWIILGAVLTVVVVAAFLILKPKAAPDDPKNSPTYSSAFFIYTNDKYTLWNKDGVRLTNDEYDEKSNFIGGYAYVKKGNEYALVREDGRLTVPFGQISRVVKSYAGLFLVEDNAGARRLWMGDGKELLAGSDLEIDAPSYSSTFLEAKMGGNYYIYNYAGRLVTQFAVVDDAELKFSTAKDFVLAFYNKTNLLFDARSGQQLAIFEGDRYEIDDVSENRGLVLLEKSDNDEGGDYKLYVSGKDFYDLNEIKYYGIVINSDMVVGYDDSYEEVALLDGNYKIARKVAADVALKDINNYAMLNEDGKVEIYVNGNLSKTIDGSSDLASGVVYDAGLYAIEANEKYGFYRLDGSFAFGEYKDIYSLFDKFGHASVSEDGDNYYMIDASGKRLNDLTYQRISTYDHSYYVRNSDGKRALIAEDGQPVTGFDYTDGSNRSAAVDHEIWTMKRDANKYDVVDVTAKKVLLGEVNPSEFYANYFIIKNGDDKKEYYTYSGLKFYTEE
ncbi:hypothetical protein IKF74_02245 [Candidatus Saccharibacteria bacterium]|nr:hypothetical protein [Candidatus Saccharibacteria bacterium]